MAARSFFAPALKRRSAAQSRSASSSNIVPNFGCAWALIGAAILILVAIAIGFLFWQRQKLKTSAPTSLIQEKSIAVLPFENRSRDPDNAYFAEGIQDEILTRLAKVADLKVISRTSTQHFKSAPDNLPQI